MLTSFAGLLVLHFLAYVVVFRHLDAGRRERSVFLFHLIPACLISVVAVSMVIAERSERALTEAVLVICLQGIYSLSFLELWSLAEGGYSLTIMMDYESSGRQGARPSLAGLEEVGLGKKANRLGTLQRLSLVQRGNDSVALTPRGRLVAHCLSALATIANVKKGG
ncbi:hypothetical protein AYO40_05640 [Planctomycetaceae bacterium SCGC AG-212-D15]|nr:hypothetical protein AYO40_05640 [Planctomycetaceae bacterium SCGC AG-212-D15]